MEPIRVTPLHDQHTAAGARMAPFGGWDMPIQYTGILAEHETTRTRSSVFDICHMGEFELKGPTARADLERLLTMSVAGIPHGRCRYGYLLRDDGGVLDDLTCYAFADDHFWLVVNAATAERNADWIRAHLSETTAFTDLSPRIAKLDIQGPTSREDLERALGATLPDLKYFACDPIRILDADALLSRTGYTGEWGYELYVPATLAVEVWSLIRNAGIPPAGLGARDTLRLEVGYPLYGHELTEERTPVAASRGQFIDLDKDFIGKDGVLRDLEQGCPRYLAGLSLDGKRAAREGDTVVLDGEAIGTVTSGSIAPSLGYAVAYAYLDAAYTEPGTRVDIEVRGKPLPATVTPPPFYRGGTARKRPTA